MAIEWNWSKLKLNKILHLGNSFLNVIFLPSHNITRLHCFGYPQLIAMMLMKNDNGSDVAKNLEIRPQLGGITHSTFIQFCHWELFRFKSICRCTLENLELTYKIKFCSISRPGSNILYVTYMLQKDRKICCYPSNFHIHCVSNARQK